MKYINWNCLFITLYTVSRVVCEPGLESTTPTVINTVTQANTSDEPPEGYYAFVVSPNAVPPRVRPPPYRHIQVDCQDLHSRKPHVTANNLCGDLNRGLIPKNPMGQNPFGEPYPFELIRNQTLKFLSRTLPVLRADDTLPRVTRLQSTPIHEEQFDDNSINGVQSERERRSLNLEETMYASETDSIPSSQLAMEHRSDHSSGAREGRGFCDEGGVFCMLYRAINGGGTSSNLERREDPGSHGGPHHPGQRFEGPPTPCPARVEYATPVFAKNYQGVWRYVVQIPYEGYFTQTIEVTRCMQSRCHYLDGGCLSSPRWTSLLVAELHYPENVLTTNTPPVHDFQNYQQYLQKRAGQPSAPEGSTEKPPHCDGHDEYGCFQVRLYYDWFLVPGSCKCWRPDYFARYVRRKTAGSDL